MLEENTCPRCKYTYELLWDDSDELFDDENQDIDFIPDEELTPEYCPFCGIHRKYGGEIDAYDDSLDE